MDVESERRAPACALVIFGASGDLTERKLLPAVERLRAYNRLPREFALVGVGRTPMTDGEFAERLRGPRARTAATSGPSSSRRSGTSAGATTTRPHTRGWPMCSTSSTARAARPATGSSTWPPRRNCSATIAASLGKSGLSDARGDGFVRIVIEKPFGWDEDSARACTPR